MIQKKILLVLFIHFNHCACILKNDSRWFRLCRRSNLILNEQLLASGDFVHSNIQNTLLNRLKKPRSFDCHQPLDENIIFDADREDVTNIIKFEPDKSELKSLDFHIFKSAVQKRFTLHRIPIIGDGNCGFRAILVAAGKSLEQRYPAGEQNHGQLRIDIVEYVKNRRKHYETLFTDNNDLLIWIKKMQNNGEWLDEIGLRAASELNQLQIVVFRPFEVVRIFEPCNNQSIIQAIYILHNGGNHFEALLTEMKDESSTIKTSTQKRIIVYSKRVETSTKFLTSSAYSFNFDHYYLCMLEFLLIKRFLQ